MKTRCFLLLLLCLSGSLKAQNILEYQFESSQNGKRLITILDELEESENASFFYLPEWIQNLTARKDYVGQSLNTILTDILSGTEIDFLAMYPKVVVIIKDPTKDILRKETLISALVQGKKIESYEFGDPSSPINRQVEIQGQIMDWTTGEPLPFATVQINDSLLSTSSNIDGRFTIKLDPGAYILNFSFLGYQ